MNYQIRRMGKWIPCHIVCEIQPGLYVIGYTHDGVPYQNRANITNLRKV